MFYDNFIRLCNEKSKAPSTVATEIGLSRASVNGWKNGKKPTDATVLKLATYFDVTVDYLLGNAEEPAATEDDELNELLEEVRRNPELRAMFSLTKNATPEQVRQYINVIKAIRGGE